MTNDLCTPWSLHFDRDGTEDFGIICDAEGNDLVASHIPGGKIPPRWKERGFGEGCFWLPEDGEEVPALVRQMRLMAAAPRLLAALKALTSTARTFRNVPFEQQAWTSTDDASLEAAFAAIAEAEGA